MQEETVQPFVKVSEKEYQIKINGKYHTINCPFAKTEKLFKIFIMNGGVIDIQSGEVQTDLLTLISSFKEVGDLLLTEFSQDGALLTSGSCSDLTASEVINLFLLATSILESFTEILAQIKTPRS